MTLTDLIKQAKDVEHDIASPMELAEGMNIFGLDIPYSDPNSFLTEVHIKKHYCTDTYVGLKAYFFHDDCFAISNQTGRKSSEDFKYVSLERYNEVYDYILSISERSDHIPILSEDELETEFDDAGYSIDHADQLIPNGHVLYHNNSKVEFVETVKTDNFFTDVIKVKNSKGVIYTVNVKDIKIGYF